MSQSNDYAGEVAADIILFVTGDSPRSNRARANLDAALQQMGETKTAICCIDLLKEPKRINEYGIFATPALIRRRERGDSSILYGDLSNERELRRFLVDSDGQAIA